MIEFSSIEELYNRLKPALNCKKNELIKKGYTYIKGIDIWNALKSLKWNDSKDLTLADMVADILNTEDSFFDDYIKDKFDKVKREIDLEGEDLL